MTTQNSFGAVATLTSGGETIEYFSLPALERAGFTGINRLPYSLKVLLENLLRREDGRFVRAEDVQALAGWDASAGRQKEIAFMPARVLLQDFTGVPCVVDLAAMRDGIVGLGGQPASARRARHRPLGAGGLLRHPAGAAAEYGSRVPPQSRAIHVPALGPESFSQLPRGAA